MRVAGDSGWGMRGGTLLMQNGHLWFLISIILIGIVIGTFVIFDASRSEPSVPQTPTPFEIEQQSDFIKPLTLSDIQVTVIRVGLDVTLLLDWERRQNVLPFHLWIEVDGSDVVLYSPNNEPRTIEVVPDEILIFYGSTLYHELTENRLAIDLQVQKKE